MMRANTSLRVIIAAHVGNMLSTAHTHAAVTAVLPYVTAITARKQVAIQPPIATRRMPRWRRSSTEAIIGFAPH